MGGWDVRGGQCKGHRGLPTYVPPPPQPVNPGIEAKGAKGSGERRVGVAGGGQQEIIEVGRDAEGRPVMK